MSEKLDFDLFVNSIIPNMLIMFGGMGIALFINESFFLFALSFMAIALGAFSNTDYYLRTRDRL